MTDNKRSKNSRQRGSKTHGWGAMKKHRGAGHRGGRGAAGSGKRGDAKKPSIWKDKRYMGSYGFTSHGALVNMPVTIAHLENFKVTLAKEGYLKEIAGTWVINLSDAGFTKLLGTGKAVSKWSITVPQATESAIEKVKKAGGSVMLTTSEESGSDDEEQGEDA